MSKFVFKLPDLGEGVVEAEIVEWHVKPGDVVKEDDNLCDVMTDKATVEIPAPQDGKVLAITGEPGDIISVGSELMTLELEGVAADEEIEIHPHEHVEEAKEAKEAKEAPKQEAKAPEPAIAEPAPAAKAAPAAAPTSAPEPKREGVVAPVRALASPAVRRRAAEAGVDLIQVPGTGPQGRVTREDFEEFLAGGGRTPAGKGKVKRTGKNEIKVIGLRRKIAEKMQTAKRHIPHFTYVEEVDVTELEALRQYLNENRLPNQPKLTVLPFLMQALVKVVQDFPELNATFDDEAGVITQYDAAHIGIATQTDNGLMVPVVKHAEAMDIWDSAAEVARVSQAARGNSATKDELTGSSITITSLGALGGIVSTPVINHPEVAIIGVNKMMEKLVMENGNVVQRLVMNLSTSCDHRVVDGFVAAQAIQSYKALLEHPATIFM
jgi:2-oxoisovalerate dehydrogenase E2 component (dihydrolipoyl transacylase)